MPTTIQEVEKTMRQRMPECVASRAPWWVLAISLLPALALADATADRLAESLSVNGQPMPVEQVSVTPMEGIYHVRLESGESFYSNADGSHFLVGDLFENADNGLVNLTEQSRNQQGPRRWPRSPKTSVSFFAASVSPRQRSSCLPTLPAPTASVFTRRFQSSTSAGLRYTIWPSRARA